jgi:cation diffusion facilitator CzcD-associated flavoprotein CzcO
VQGNHGSDGRHCGHAKWEVNEMNISAMEEPIGLTTLERLLAQDFAMLNHLAAEWVPPRFDVNGQRIVDVLIVGGGMCGVTAALQLRRLGIHNIRIIDAADKGLEGPWRTFARMETLRSPKHLTGPASGMPRLTFRAWYEAQHGSVAWDVLGYIPRLMWADYMAWFARVTGARVENGIRLETLNANDESWTAGLINGASGQREAVQARYVVLATGRENIAVPRMPELFRSFHHEGVLHTGDGAGRDLMSGKDVAVIGLGASAFDYAAEALEGGARRVTILGRSGKLSRVNKGKQIVYAGFTHGFPLLADKEKMEIFECIFRHGVAPPRGTVKRVMRHDNVRLALKSPVVDLQRADNVFHITTPRERLTADLIILGTGYRVDVAAATYLGSLSQSIRRWKDVVVSDDGNELRDFPYLGSCFEFQSRDGHDAAALSRLLCFNHAAMLSLGNLANDIPAVSEGAERLAKGLAASLYLEDKSTHFDRLRNYKEPELTGDEVPGLHSWWPDVEA